MKVNRHNIFYAQFLSNAASDNESFTKFYKSYMQKSWKLFTVGSDKQIRGLSCYYAIVVTHGTGDLIGQNKVHKKVTSTVFF